MDREVEHRVRLCKIGKRDPDADLAKARESVKTTRETFKNSYDRKKTPSTAASDAYAKALREEKLCEIVLDQIEHYEMSA